MRHRILVAADIDRIGVRLLEDDGRLAVRVEPRSRASELAAVVGDAEVLVTRYHNEVTAAVLSAGPHLRAVVQGTSGLDNIDHAAAAEMGIAIVGIPGENANAVAEIVIGYMLGLTRSIPAYDRMVRGGAWERSDCARRREMRSHRLGIVGLGRVGTCVANLAGRFDMTVRAYDPYVTDEQIAERGAVRCETLSELLRGSDILTLHVPLTEETRRMIGERELGMLPGGAFVINTSRGQVLDTAALLAALSSRRLGGAALDVYETEPPAGIAWPDDPRLILTPHIAGCSLESKVSIGRAIYRTVCAQFGLEPRG